MKCMYDMGLASLLSNTKYVIMCIGVGPTTCPRSLIPKRKTVPSFLSPYMDVGLRIMYSMCLVQYRPHVTIQATVVRHAPELQCESMYPTRRE